MKTWGLTLAFFLLLGDAALFAAAGYVVSSLIFAAFAGVAAYAVVTSV